MFDKFPQSLCFAELHTDHFRFEAVGNSKAQARSVMIEMIKKHCKQRQFPYAEFRRHYPDDCIEYRTLTVGDGYRDGEKFLTPAAA
jgi:hypothetical protein